MTFNLDGRLCRAGRALVGWSEADLAAAASVAKQTIVDFEQGARRPYPSSRRAIAAALASAGVTLVEESGKPVGVRLREPEGTPDTGAIVARAMGPHLERPSHQA